MIIHQKNRKHNAAVHYMQNKSTICSVQTEIKSIHDKPPISVFPQSIS